MLHFVTREINLDLAVTNRVPAHGRILIKLQTRHVLLRQSEIEDLRVLQNTRVSDRLWKRHISLMYQTLVFQPRHEEGTPHTFCKLQRTRTWAGVFPCFLDSVWRTGSFIRVAWTRGEYASTTMLRFCSHSVTSSRGHQGWISYWPTAISPPPPLLMYSSNSSSCLTPKFDTPMERMWPAFWASTKARHVPRRASFPP